MLVIWNHEQDAESGSEKLDPYCDGMCAVSDGFRQPHGRCLLKRYVGAALLVPNSLLANYRGR